MPNALEHLAWRYATKAYDPAKKLTDEQRHVITEALRLAPSSYGLQPWVFVHVTDPALREQLKAKAWNQSQLTDASDVWVLCARRTVDEAYIDRYLASTAAARGIDVSELAGFRAMLVGSASRLTSDQMLAWNAKQVYIALGVAMQAAAEHRIDTTPMEGFDAAAFDEILGLGEKGVTSCVVLAAGFRAEADGYQHAAKSRFAASDVFVEM